MTESEITLIYFFLQGFLKVKKVKLEITFCQIRLNFDLPQFLVAPTETWL